jgi:hypothetical protein
MKTKKNKKSNLLQTDRSRKLVYFHIHFISKEIEKKFLHMISNPEYVLKMIESCKETLKQDCNYTHKVYNEIRNILLQPNVNVHELCVSVFKYICCSPQLDERLYNNPKGNISVYSDIKIDYENIKITASEGGVVIKYPGNYTPVKKSELSIPLITRLMYLNDEDSSILICTAVSLMLGKVSTKKFTYTQLMSYLTKQENNEVDITRIKKILDNLVFYEFITLPPMVSNKEDNYDEEADILISLIDLKNWNKCFRIGRKRQLSS